MTTITFEENIRFDKKHFKTIKEFQLYLLQIRQKSELSDEHKKILDDRIEYAKNNPDKFLTVEQLKSSLK
ncbi:MAG: hypothetical protein GXO86_14790 [Chlorobi bacterium]|nr:hypothetical protein [Chlorobiota bacterium]